MLILIRHPGTPKINVNEPILNHKLCKVSHIAMEVGYTSITLGNGVILVLRYNSDF